MKALHPNTLKHSVLLGALLLAAPSLHATLLVYEGFDYGSSAITNINGTAGTGTGTQGSWTATNLLPGGGLASSAYQTTGLSFGSNFATSSGGALLQTTRYSGTNAQTTATLQLNATATGTVWNSYLVNYSTLGTGATGAAISGVATAADGATLNLGSRVNTNATAGQRTVSAFYDSTPSTSAASAFAADTYLVLSRFTNVGNTLSGGSPGVATVWFFTQAGYDNWFTTGSALEANLSTYATRTQTDTLTSGSLSFSSIGYLAFKTDAPDVNNAQVVAVYDELRYGTDLIDVISLSSVPEPSTYALIAGSLGLAGSIIVRRRSKPDA